MIDRIVGERRKRYDKLHELLADPNVIGNSAEYQKCAKELAGLTPIMKEYDVYLKISKDLKDLEKALSEPSSDSDYLILAEEERHKLKIDLKSSEEKLEEMILEKESGGDRNIIMEIRAGTGGLEASLFAGDLLRMYSRYATKMGWKVELIDSSTTEKGGYKEVIISISGTGVYGNLKFESGTHR
ncbi:MAG: PCRF domain-containing protein, partial [Candidatus Omnitrophica bacterium]|nr:PCRF domain-containing protein [Candidatus Omnitrophota bacterium]